MLLVIGLGISLASAALWHSSVSAHERQRFQVSATDVSETLETLLARDNDFVITLRAVVALEPNMSAKRFDRWFAQLQGKQRELGGLGTTVVESVPADELAAFQARRAADPAFRKLVGGTIVTVPNSGRARYCLLSAGGTVTPYTHAIGELVEGDWCNPSSAVGSYPTGKTTEAKLIQSVTDSAQPLVYPLTAQGVSALFIEAPVYRLGAPVASVAERRAAVQAWVGSSFEIDTVIRQALGGYHGLAVALYHRDPGEAEERVGQVGANSVDDPLTHSAQLDLDGSWRAVVHGSATADSLSATEQALLVFLGGALVRDRAEQMLARARRQQLAIGALYVDLDGFKHINDTFGRAAGDELIDDVRQALHQSGLDPAKLTLEITETTLMRDADAAATRLHQLKQLGIRIAIDDFGTGYSSLAYLRQFPADALKIDRSLIDGIATSTASAALTNTLVQRHQHPRSAEHFVPPDAEDTTRARGA